MQPPSSASPHSAAPTSRARLKVWVRAALAIAVVVAALLAALVIDGLSDRLQKSDVAIVPGSQVQADGRLSERLQARLDRTVALYRQGWFRYIFVSGGTGVEGIDEARAMKHYLLTQHVPESAIWVDSAGHNTAATARNAAALMRSHGLTRAMVVTQYFHVTRSRWLLQRAGLPTVHSAHAHFVEWRDVYSTLREGAALVVYASGLKAAP
jgi:vancomycin permeability regulator SanA